ncbi:MAG: glycosyltransferase [FCB group bacterium]|jgi:GT2 family glycosyltransferase
MKISVIIVTQNRKDDLKLTISEFLKQTYQDKEIIVIDNASNDGTSQMMKDNFSEIKYLWLPDNIDILAINLGVEMSDGDIIWRTDDDSHPENIKVFEDVINIFNHYPEIDVIATEDIEVRQNYQIWKWYPLKINKNKIPPAGFVSNIFPGTGAAIRKKVFNKIGGFWNWGFEELDFCTRAIIAGFNIRYFPNIRVLHYATTSDRKNPNRWIKHTKQFMRYTWKYFPFFNAFFRTFLIMFSQLIIGIAMLLPISALIEGFFSSIAIIFSTFRNERQPIPKDKIKDITLGINLFKTQIIFFKNVFSRKMNKWAKK